MRQFVARALCATCKTLRAGRIKGRGGGNHKCHIQTALTTAAAQTFGTLNSATAAWRCVPKSHAARKWHPLCRRASGSCSCHVHSRKKEGEEPGLGTKPELSMCRILPVKGASAQASLEVKTLDSNTGCTWVVWACGREEKHSLKLKG